MQTRQPSRITIHDQLVVMLKEGIETQRWETELPSESVLCREMQVSRMTLRKAIGQLAREQWIEPGGRGRRHQILKQGKAGHGRSSSRTQSGGTVIRVLAPYAAPSLGSFGQSLLKNLAERVAGSGLRVEFECHPRLFASHLPDDLARLVALPDTAGWVLCYSTEAMQQWFSRQGRPCVVIGTLHDGVGLSSVQLNTPAQCRHAAGMLTARGHNKVVHLIAKLTSLSDQLGSEEFVAEGRRLGGDFQSVTYDATPRSICRAINATLAGRPRPSAYYITCPEDCVTALCHLQRAGIRVPEDVELLAGWNDVILNHTTPTFAKYRIDLPKLAREIGSILLDQIRNGSGKIRESHLIPEFVAGETLRPKRPLLAAAGSP